MKKLLILLLSLSTAFVASAQQEEASYKIYDVKQQKEVTLKELIATVPAGTVLIFGEQHDDSIAHDLQYRLLQLLQQDWGSKKVLLSMEMFQKDVQYIVDEYLRGLISEKNFTKEARAWGNYTDYKPMVEYAKNHGISILAANTPSRYTNMVTTKGLGSLELLSKETRKQYLPPLPIDTLQGGYYDMFLEAMGGHTIPGFNLYQSQNVWDATMAHSIAGKAGKYRNGIIYHLCGRFHSDYGEGTVFRLRREYNLPVMVISSFYQDDIKKTDWDDWNRIGDYVIITRSAKSAPPSGSKN